jgi:hypothetical protein
VASSFIAIMKAHHPLQARGLTDAFEDNPALAQIAALATTPQVHLHLCDAAGAPYDGAHLTGVTAVGSGSGLFTLNAATGTGSDLTGTVGKEAASTSYKEEVRRLLLLGPATTGRLSDSFHPPAMGALPTGVALTRDFFRLRVAQLDKLLLGTKNAAFVGAQLEQAPRLRVHESVRLLSDGNDVLAGGNLALLGTPRESLAVAQRIDGAFDVPEDLGGAARLPTFPPFAGTPSTAPLTAALKASLAPAAQYFDDGDPATANTDVILTLNGLPAGAWVRVYHRKFIEDAREARGDGAGGVVPASGTLILRLRDPLGLRVPGRAEGAITVPLPATLRCDLCVTKRDGSSRIYGNVSAQITSSTTTDAPSLGGTNLFAAANLRGVSNAGVLGLGIRGGTLPTDTLQAILALTGEANPRDASRLPTMARRELMVAGLGAGTSWKAVLAGGRLTGETISFDPRHGAPGSPGGRETQVVGAFTQNGRLAYDIARMAYRRSKNVIERLIGLADSKWTEPAEPAELPATTVATPGAASGTFAGAVLQTISPFCETPELAILKTFLDGSPSSLPRTFNDLIDWVKANLVPGAIPFRQQLLDALDGLKTNSTLTETDKERIFNELHREITSACYGRRDAQWALADAIGRARRFLYIESPGFTSTQKDYGAGAVPPYAADLLAKLRDRLAAAPGLHVMICTPKFADFAAGYEPLAAHEIDDRKKRVLGRAAEGPTPAIAGLEALNLGPEASRVVAFHPVGFPGRPSRVESTVVIADDTWMLLGSSTFRRRGLTFDGGSDLVLTDTDLVRGSSPAIARFRRELLAARLGVAAAEVNGFGRMPDPSFVRLADGVEAFYVIRERLRAGGLGAIERLWKGELPGQTPIPPDAVSMDVANPEGHEFDLATALAVSVLASLGGLKAY